MRKGVPQRSPNGRRLAQASESKHEPSEGSHLTEAAQLDDNGRDVTA